MSINEHKAVIATLYILTRLQREKFNLYRATVINYLQKQLDDNLERVEAKL